MHAFMHAVKVNYAKCADFIEIFIRCNSIVTDVFHRLQAFIEAITRTYHFKSHRKTKKYLSNK